MTKIAKQTWWDKEIKNQFEDFKSWVGGPQAYSKKNMRNYILKKKYKSIIDIGCGMCDDYFVYKQLDSDIEWLGVDSSKFLINARDPAIPVLNREAHDTNFDDNQFEVAYARHVLEHQKSYKPILTEMVRIAEKMVIHIFFIPPRDKEIINWQKETNLYHNTFTRKEIEEFLYAIDKVESVSWVNVATEIEEGLVVTLK